MTEQEKIIESLEQRAWKIIDELGINIDDEMKKIKCEYSECSGLTKIIDFLMNYFIFLNDEKCPDTDGIINPVIASDMVDWFREASKWHFIWIEMPEI